MYEHKSQPLLPLRMFFIRVIKHLAVSMLLFGVSLGIGILGYRYLADFSWIDSTLNASMILGGMGPVNDLPTNAAKIFASAYALFAGIVFVAGASIMIAPFAHRILHQLHLEMEEPSG
jgi:hypothetical protein